MTVIYLTLYNTRGYGVTFRSKVCNKVQKFKGISDIEDNI